jgi:predicted site-specific integrase-resolvase
MEKQILNKTDAAELLGVDRRTVYNWARDGFGPKFSRLPGGREVTTRKSCEEFLEALTAGQ